MDDLPLSPSLRARQRPDPYQGISSSPFPPEVVEVLTAALSEEDVEIKLDGLLFLPEIKYRRTLNRAFSPGGWALMPMGDILHFQVTLELLLTQRLLLLHCAVWCPHIAGAAQTWTHVVAA